jgi:O-6-methylguanine DNA methyltransferase
VRPRVSTSPATEVDGILPGVSEIIHTAEFESRLGLIRVASSPQGLAYVGLPFINGRGFSGWLERHTEDTVVREDYAANLHVIRQLSEYIDGKRKDFELELDLRATDFQARIYDVTREIPFGETCSYGEIAKRASCPKAVRAVGAALGANPIPLVIPCHRVISSGGRLQGYAGGLEVKARLLAGESAGPRAGQLF